MELLATALRPSRAAFPATAAAATDKVATPQATNAPPGPGCEKEVHCLGRLFEGPQRGEHHEVDNIGGETEPAERLDDEDLKAQKDHIDNDRQGHQEEGEGEARVRGFFRPPRQSRGEKGEK